MFTRLRQNLNRDIIGHQFLFDQLAYKIKIWLRRCRKTYFDLFKSNINEQLEHFQLLVRCHGFDQGLVTIAEVDATPGRCLRDDTIRPTT